MTACNDVQNNSLGKKAVSAALMGTLAVGMVPATALAATAPEANDGIETLTADEVAAYAKATVSQVQINNGASQATPSSIELVAGDNANDVVPTELTSVITGTTLSLLNEDGTFNDTDFELQYDGGSLAKPQGDMPTAAGNYTVQVLGASGGKYDGLASAKLAFSIVGKSLQGATLYEVQTGDKANDISDTTFTYNAEAQKIGIALNGAVLPKTDPDTKADNYTVKYYNAQGNTLVNNGLQSDTNIPVAAGDYIAVVTGAGKYAGSETQIKFTVNKLDLTTADVTVSDALYVDDETAVQTAVTEIDGQPVAKGSTLAGELDYTYPVVPIKTGAYEVVVSAQPENKNITGSKTVSFNVVKNNLVVVQYDKAALADQTIYLNATPAQSFDLSKISVYAGKVDGGNTVPDGDALATDEYTVTVTDKDGKTVPASSLATPGKWKVTVAVDSKANGYVLGGSDSATVTVYNGQIDADDIFVTYDGKTQDEFSAPYNGSDYLPQVAVKVVVGDKTLTAGTDYQVVYKEDGAAVTEMVNAGTYGIGITSDTWNYTGTAGGDVCEFTIDPVELTVPGDLTVANQVTVNGDTGLAYTGSDITPSFTYTVVGADNKKKTVDLPASAYEITKIVDAKTGKEVKSIKAAGSYKVTLADNAKDPNYEITGGEIPVKVIDDKMFADVPADAWYAEVVDQAALAGYMNGYAGTDLFGPNDKITRAQVACVLFNMSGGKVTGSEDNGFNENYGYTSFADVNPKAYYAQAVAWAKDAGVVNGFAGTDNFGPDQLVTREQFACMLWNYAKVNLSDTVKDVDVAAALASKPDGNKVSDWAKDGVAWAVQNKIMGNGGVIDPLTTVTRAETAAMVMNYKPYVKVTEITANPDTVNVAAGAVENVAISIAPANATNQKWVAVSEDTSVATVDATTGAIKGVNAGSTTVTYTSVANNAVSVSVAVTVK